MLSYISIGYLTYEGFCNLYIIAEYSVIADFKSFNSRLLSFVFLNLGYGELVLPETLRNIPHHALINLPKLQELTISSQYELQGDVLFILKEKCLESIELPSSTKKVNGTEIAKLTTYTIPTNITKLNDYCFANCNELIEIKGIEQIKEFGKGCFMNCYKLNKEQYPQVKHNNEEYLNEFINEKEQKQLEEWTELKCSEVIFNSDVDNWSDSVSMLKVRIIGKKQLIFLIEDEEGEKFGYYLHTQVVEKYDKRIKTDNKTFHFNLESKDNRLQQPMKFEIKYLKYKFRLFKKTYWNDNLISLGDIELMKENYKNGSYCSQYEDIFDYHGIENALCGKTIKFGKYYFTPKRIVVIQMK